MAGSRRASNFPRWVPGHERTGSRDGDKEEIWKPMLDNISSGKRLPEKSILVLGGTTETQREFLDSISTDSSNSRRPPDRGRKPPIANQFALGYTYQDVLDSDHEDTLARLSLYLLADPSPSFTPLIKPYLNPRTLPHTLIVILLDWNHPWLWIRQLRDWIRVLRSLILSMDDASKVALEENLQTLQNKGRTISSEGGAMGDVKIPLGPGEWDEPLGIPLCVVCQNADKIEMLEKERGWKEEEFDFILQYLRTILLKHGSSLIYTMPSAPGSLQTLIHSALGIKSLLKQEQLRHNVTDRDRVVVPPNWDSWAKVRILREGFDIEGISEKWSIDIEIPRHMRPTNGELPPAAPAIISSNTEPHTNSITNSTATAPTSIPLLADEDPDTPGPSATSIYEDTIRNPESTFPLSTLSRPVLTSPTPNSTTISTAAPTANTNAIEVPSKPPQTFLTEQLGILELLRRDDDNEAALKAARKESEFSGLRNAVVTPGGSGGDDAQAMVVEEHIGPVQFNMGGIQVNADEMVRRLQDREANRVHDGGAASSAPDPNKMDNEKLMSFFSGLINKGPSGSAGRGA